MKTIRYNTYETNSSSTHSITVINKDLCDDARPLEIFADDVLYPSNIKGSNAYIQISSYGEDGYNLRCYTVHQKAALTVHYLNACDEYLMYNQSGITEEQYNAFKIEAISILCDLLGLKEIKDWQSCYDFYYSGENQECPIVPIINSVNPTEAFATFVNDVILNDDIVIIDENIPY